MAKITVQNTNVTVISVNENDYISLTDIAKYKSDDPTAVIGNWMRNRNTIEYLGIWESLYNPQFNEAVSKFRHSLFYFQKNKQSPDFPKPGLCHVRLCQNL